MKFGGDRKVIRSFIARCTFFSLFALLSLLPSVAGAQGVDQEKLFGAVREADQHFAEIRLINKLYNRDFLSWMGRNIDPEEDFDWRWHKNFDPNGNPALLVFHTNAYGCGMYLCTADIWIGHAGNFTEIASFSLASDEEIEVLDSKHNGYPVLLVGNRGFAFSPASRKYVDINNIEQ